MVARVAAAVVIGGLLVAACGSSRSTSPTAARAPIRPAAAAENGPVLPPEATVTAQPYASPAGGGAGLAPGQVVPAARVGVGVFADARHGFTLASINYETYPAATADGGRTWRIAGPVLPLPPALGRSQPGVAGPDTYFASEGFGGTTVVEVTTDAGRHWWQTLLPGGPVFVGAFNGELTAIVAVPGSTPETAVAFWAYHSRSGRRWRYDGTLNAVS